MSHRFEKVERLLHEALEKPVEERSAFLVQACPEDEGLRREVESLLGMESQAGPFLEVPAVEATSPNLAGEATQLPVGKVFGSYQILSLLGRGRHGRRLQSARYAAEPVCGHQGIAAQTVSDPERKRRFIQEARSASALNHPNIITTYDIGSEGGIDFIAMEYVAGKTLDQLIGRKGMKLHEALKLAVQMADALAKAHSAGIVHRDLKPTNVMVTEDGLVKVLDFGLAKLTEVVRPEGETRTLESLTEEGMIVGTAPTCRPSRRKGRRWMPGQISSALGRCFTRWSADRRRSKATRRCPHCLPS